MSVQMPRDARGWSLRDLRRAVAAGWVPPWVSYADCGWMAAAGLPPFRPARLRFWPPTRRPRPSYRADARRDLIPADVEQALARAIDRRIAQLGAYAPAWLDHIENPGAGEQRRGATPSKKQESEDAELTSAPCAGGTARPDETADGAEPPAETDPAPREGGEADASEQPSEVVGAPHTGERTATSDAVDGEGDGAATPASPEARGGTEADHRGATPADDGDEPAQETPGSAGPDTALESDAERRESRSPTGETAPSSPPPGDARVPLTAASGAGDQDLLVTPATRPGGVYYTLADVKPEDVQRELRQARQLEAALERWLRHLDAGAAGSPSPRLDGGRLVRELVSRRCSLSRARRWEREIGTVLILVDVSGSCSVAAPGTMLAAMAFAAAHPGRVAVVVHSNGHPRELAGVAARWKDRLPELRPGRPDFQRLADFITGQIPTLAGLLVLGDWHAGDLIQACAQRAPTIWLDDYASTHGVKPASKALQRGWTARRRPVVWWQGVNTAEAAAQAVRAACRVSAT